MQEASTQTEITVAILQVFSLGKTLVSIRRHEKAVGHFNWIASYAANSLISSSFIFILSFNDIRAKRKT